MSKLSWVATGFALSGQICMIFKNPLSFILWSIGEGILLYSSLKRKEYGEVSFFTLYIVTNIIALVAWSR
jgi:hypothetical protein